MAASTRLDFGPGDALILVRANGTADVAIYDVEGERPTDGSLLGHGIRLMLDDPGWRARVIERVRGKLNGGPDG